MWHSVTGTLVFQPKNNIELGRFWREWRMPQFFVLKNISSPVVFPAKPWFSDDARPTSLCPREYRTCFTWKTAGRSTCSSWISTDPIWTDFSSVFFIFDGSSRRFHGSAFRGQICIANSAADDLFAGGNWEGWSLYNTELRSTEMKWYELEPIVMKQDEGLPSYFPHPICIRNKDSFFSVSSFWRSEVAGDSECLWFFFDFASQPD